MIISLHLLTFVLFSELVISIHLFTADLQGVAPSSKLVYKPHEL